MRVPFVDNYVRGVPHRAGARELIIFASVLTISLLTFRPAAISVITITGWIFPVFFASPIVGVGRGRHYTHACFSLPSLLYVGARWTTATLSGLEYDIEEDKAVLRFFAQAGQAAPSLAHEASCV